MWLRQNTASQEISLGQFLDSTDGNTEENSLTIANTDIKLRKGGTTTLSNKNSGGATSISNGVYHTTLDATDTNTLGLLEVYVHVAGALATKSSYMILPATSYDALVTNGLNDIAATDIVTGGAISTSGGVVKADPLYNGAIHIDSVNGVGGTTVNTNGTERLPVRNMSDAFNLSSATKINVFKIAPGSSLSLSGGTSNKVLEGQNWILDLNGQDTSNSVIQGAFVSGTTTNGSNLVTFRTCRLSNITAGRTLAIEGCYIDGTYTANASELYEFDKIRTVEGSASKFDFNSMSGADAAFVQFAGILQIENLGSATFQTLDVKGIGKVTLKSTCTGGEFSFDGNLRITDNSVTTTVFKSDYTKRLEDIEVDTGTDLPVQISGISSISASDVWTFATRELTSGNNIVLAKGVGITGFNDLSFDDIWTGTLTESYAADGAAITPAQGMHMIWSDLRSPQQVSTTWTDFRLNNTTASMTFTLDDATTPTKKTRAT